MEFEEDEGVIVPCRCTSVSLKLIMKEGVFDLHCNRCGGFTRIRITRDAAGGWDIKSEPLRQQTN